MSVRRVRHHLRIRQHFVLRIRARFRLQHGKLHPVCEKSMVDGGDVAHAAPATAAQRNLRSPPARLSEIEAEFRPIKYLKVDAEGTRKKKSTLSQPIPLISLEFNFPQMYDIASECCDQRTSGEIEYSRHGFPAPIFIGAINSSGWRYSVLFALLNTNCASRAHSREYSVRGRGRFAARGKAWPQYSAQRAGGKWPD